ncbi:10456_t:CDS:2 [Funneliformis geosporum]|nr:10456_t:CDS:2 [Funneliformis geosporum]
MPRERKKEIKYIALNSFFKTIYGSLHVIFRRASLGGDENCAAIRANFPIPEQCGLFYFEIDIIDKGENGEIGIGFCTKSASLNKMPGWEDSSWGYHGDDGKKFFNADGEPFGPKFMTSDTIGCCLNFINNTKLNFYRIF